MVDAELSVDIATLAHGQLVPLVEGILRQHPNLNCLSSPLAIELGVLRDIEDNQLGGLRGVEQEAFNNIHFLVWARIAMEVVSQETFCGTLADEFMKKVGALKRYFPSLDLSGDAYSFIARCCEAALEADKVVEVEYLQRCMKQVKEEQWTSDIDIFIEQSKQRYEVLIVGNQLDRTYDGLQTQLESLRFLEDCEHNIELEVYKELAVYGVSSYVYENSEAQNAKLLIGQMDVMQYQDEVVKAQLETLKQEFGLVSPAPIQMIESEKQASNVPNAPESQGDLIASSKQLLLQREPEHSNTDIDPKIYVFFGKVKDTQIAIAAKVYVTRDLSKLNCPYEKEAKILAELSGKMSQFLQFYSTFTEQEEDGNHRLYIIMEKCETNLMKVIRDRKQTGQLFTEQELEVLVGNLVQGFAYLDARGIYHNDIKPHNIFVTADKQLKIGDFNIADVSDSVENGSCITFQTGSYAVQGTDGYMPPEIQRVLDQRKNNPHATPQQAKLKKNRVDIYSLGLTILQLATLETVNGLSNEEEQDRLAQRIGSIPYEWLRVLLSRMLTYRYNDRGHMKNLLAKLPVSAQATQNQSVFI